MSEKLLLFDRWDLTEVKVNDPGLRRHINLKPIVIPRTGGRYAPNPFQKEKVSIVERFMNKLMVSGHRGKKHRLTSGHQVGKTQGLYRTMKDAFDIIEKRTKKNPVQVLVMAIENSALLEEIAAYRLGGIIARSSVVVSPQRRIDIALRHISQGVQKTSFKNKKTLAQVIADELVAASNNDPKSHGVQERNRIEREAEGTR